MAENKSNKASGCSFRCIVNAVSEMLTGALVLSFFAAAALQPHDIPPPPPATTAPHGPSANP